MKIVQFYTIKNWNQIILNDSNWNQEFQFENVPFSLIKFETIRTETFSIFYYSTNNAFTLKWHNCTISKFWPFRFEFFWVVIIKIILNGSKIKKREKLFVFTWFLESYFSGFFCNRVGRKKNNFRNRKWNYFEK